MPGKKREIHLVLKSNLADLIEDRAVISYAIGSAGECIMFLVNPADVPMVKSYYVSKVGSIPRSRAEKTSNGVGLVFDGNQVQRVTISNLSLAHPIVQTLPYGNLLLVGSRCRRFDDGTAERNAQIYSPDGLQIREMTFGDGIADVQATPSGAIWVSYFDEGIFGNYGWGNDDRSRPIGASGLVQFDDQGKKAKEFVPPDGFDTIADCYALNLYDEEVWLYYYAEFPIVHINPGQPIHGWKTTTAGARALATDGQRVLFFGGYKPHQERCVLGVLGASELTNISEGRLVLPSGEACSGGWIIGRGPLLHVFTGSAWYQADVRIL